MFVCCNPSVIAGDVDGAVTEPAFWDLPSSWVACQVSHPAETETNVHMLS